MKHPRQISLSHCLGGSGPSQESSSSASLLRVGGAVGRPPPMLFLPLLSEGPGSPAPRRCLARPRVALVDAFRKCSKAFLTPRLENAASSLQPPHPPIKTDILPDFELLIAIISFFKFNFYCYYFLTRKHPKASFNFSCEAWFGGPRDFLWV